MSQPSNTCTNGQGCGHPTQILWVLGRVAVSFSVSVLDFVVEVVGL